MRVLAVLLAAAWLAGTGLAALHSARHQRHRGRHPVLLEATRARRDDQVDGVEAVPRVPRPPAERRRRCLRPRLDGRLPGRVHLPLPLDLQLRQQQHQLGATRNTTASSRRRPGRRIQPSASASTTRPKASSPARGVHCRSCRSSGPPTSSWRSRTSTATRSTQWARSSIGACRSRRRDRLDRRR
jgi:hypothetical protein